jgi:L-aminopeptidase/D-esterase-like protein
MESMDDALPPEKIAFIAYNIGVYESVQKFGSLITSGKLSNGTDATKVAELLSHARAFYDADMIASIINAMLYNTKDKIIERVRPEHVSYVMRQLKATGVSLP